MRREYFVVVAPVDGQYLLYAPSYRAPLAPASVSGNGAIEMYLEQGRLVRGRLKVKSLGWLTMPDGSVVHVYITGKRTGSEEWKTSLELAVDAPVLDARVFLAALGVMPRANR